MPIDVHTEPTGPDAASERAVRLLDVYGLVRSGAWELDLCTGEFFWTDSVYALFELDPEEFSPSYESFLSRIHPEDRDLVDAAFIGSVQSNDPYDIRHRLLLPEGGVRWVREAGWTERDAHGDPVRSSGIVEDITDLVKYEERLQKSAVLQKEKSRAQDQAKSEARRDRELLTQALAVGRMAAWELDVATSTFRFSEEFYRVFRTSAAREGGLTMSVERYASRFLPPEARPLVAQTIKHFVSGPVDEDVALMEHPVVFGDGSSGFVQVSARVERDDFGRALRMIGVNRDVTDRANRVRELHDLNQELEAYTAEAERLAREAESADHAKSVFLANMSHEVRTPVIGVLGMTELLLELGLDDEQLDVARAISGSAESLLEILDGILEFSQLDRGKVRLDSVAFDLEECITDSVDPFMTTATEKGLEVIVRLDPALETSRVGDPARLRRILGNLIGNAVKFTREGHVLVEAKSYGERVEIAVHDTGIGIPADALEELFQPFRQEDSSTTRRFTGTGLGLTIGRQLAEAMGGSLVAESRKGQGSVLRLRVPLDMVEAETVSVRPRRRPSDR